jgi:hypothetical protein
VAASILAFIFFEEMDDFPVRKHAKINHRFLAGRTMPPFTGRRHFIPVFGTGVVDF